MPRENESPGDLINAVDGLYATAHNIRPQPYPIGDEKKPRPFRDQMSELREDTYFAEDQCLVATVKNHPMIPDALALLLELELCIGNAEESIESATGKKSEGLAKAALQELHDKFFDRLVRMGSMIHAAYLISGNATSSAKPLNPTQEQALQYIKSHPGVDAKTLAKEIGVEEGHLRSRIIPALKRHVYNLRDGSGYRAKAT